MSSGYIDRIVTSKIAMSIMCQNNKNKKIPITCFFNINCLIHYSPFIAA